MSKLKLKRPPQMKYRGFEPGKHGSCEATLYEFREEAIPQDLPETIDPTATAQRALKERAFIAAITLEEALDYLRWRNPDFRVDQVITRGLITMVSGSPLD